MTNALEYRVFPPAHRLQKQIRKYYIFKMPQGFPDIPKTLFADGSMDLFINLGPGRPHIDGHGPLEPGTCYLSGIMTSFIRLSRTGNCTIIGVQFRPGGLSYFFDISLPEYAGQVKKFPMGFFLPLPSDDLIHGLDRFFLSRLSPLPSISNLVGTIEATEGQISVKAMAHGYGTSCRTLERLFLHRVGISPKEYAAFVRYRTALGRMLEPHPRPNEKPGSLMHLAFDTGYYDHAHLTREIKKFTGMTPTVIQQFDASRVRFLSDFLFY